MPENSTYCPCCEIAVKKEVLMSWAYLLFDYLNGVSKKKELIALHDRLCDLSSSGSH